MASLHDPRDLFDDEDDDDDSQFDSDDDPAGAGASAGGGGVYAPSDFIPTPNPNPAFYNGGAAQALHASYTALTAPDLLLYPTHTASPKRPRSSSSAAADESRRIFQKLWTDEDEIAILQGFLDFTTQRGTTHADYQYDTGPFFDQIRTRLQLDFNKNQLVEKLRRLKRKYRTAVNRLNSGKDFKTAHDRATFEISQKIWNSDFKRERKRRCTGNNNNNANNANNAIRPVAEFCNNVAINGGGELHLLQLPQLPQLPQMKVEAAEGVPVQPVPAQVTSVVEETVKSCLTPIFKDLLQVVVGGAGVLSLNPPVLPGVAGAEVDERWRQQQILELEVFMKRTELVQEQVTRALEELKSRGDDKREPAGSEELNTTVDGELKSTGADEVNAIGTEEIKTAWVEEVKSTVVEELMAIEVEELKPIMAE